MTGLLCALPFAAALFGACADPGPLATGYVEGDFTLIAPVATAQIRGVTVTSGDTVAAGQVLVTMERRDAEIALARAEAALAQSESQLMDLQEGKRPAEIRAIEASLASAKAQAEDAARTRDRMVSLASRGAVTESQRDDAVTAATVAEAHVAQIEAELAVARLPARAQAIAAAKAAMTGAEAARDEARWNLDQRTLAAPAAGTIFDVIRHEGEIAGPSSPVLSMLAEGAVKLRLYVPETEFSQVSVGTLLAVNCDGCGAGMTARVTYVSDEAEFTPPVIYSLENRQKLVYLIEARPTLPSSLKPGQIVDVSLAETAQ
ncbi:HlyD family efflux transporter periplasmic adaptor subunit [Salipiger sp. P9]|uniref:HlyD family secretion protein n=1 Tax=Salipiger pentaromativorans TaxID=2943193 RepID=UPI0021580B45|nr:HlyD family efflux transporter periplasmic adaptor subunit [Salipiger pentaromativorans]MCR8547964.1 HlyD family efflux transporter periplasmic adaptor subunit [Salipiger pentaromativorans]